MQYFFDNPQLTNAKVYDFALLCIVPGPVTGLGLTSISSSVLEVRWNSPEVTNGVIVSYSIKVEIQSGIVFDEHVPKERKAVLITGLSKIILL